MSLWNKLFGHKKTETEAGSPEKESPSEGTASFKELMEEYGSAYGNPQLRWRILQKAAALALDSGNIGQQLVVNAEINSFRERYGTMSAR